MIVANEFGFKLIVGDLASVRIHCACMTTAILFVRLLAPWWLDCIAISNLLKYVEPINYVFVD